MSPQHPQEARYVVDVMADLHQHITQLQQQLTTLQAINQPSPVHVKEFASDVEEGYDEENSFAPLQAAPPGRRMPHVAFLEVV